jgi:hypothetical protein
MAQILRIDCPLFAKGLKLPQRICYFNAMAHFFYALPRLIFLTSPIFYLIFGKLNIPGYWLTILVLCAAPPGDGHDHQLAHSGREAALFLERNLRDGALSLHLCCLRCSRWCRRNLASST